MLIIARSKKRESLLCWEGRNAWGEYRHSKGKETIHTHSKKGMRASWRGNEGTNLIKGGKIDLLFETGSLSFRARFNEKEERDLLSAGKKRRQR